MLSDILSDALGLLAGGAADPGSAWRNMALGSVDRDGAPQVRMVVLRRFDPVARVLEVHTDTRSGKFGELQARAVATLHGWDAAGRIQLRASGGVTLHVGDAVAADAWAALRPGSRATYRVQPGPGTPCETRDGAGADADEASAYDVFCVIRLHVSTLEYLHLAQPSHRRARFGWADGAATAMWLVP